MDACNVNSCMYKKIFKNDKLSADVDEKKTCFYIYMYFIKRFYYKNLPIA